MARQKTPTTFRFSDRTRELMAALAAKYDTTLTEVVQRAVRELAEREGVVPEIQVKGGGDVMTGDRAPYDSRSEG